MDKNVYSLVTDQGFADEPNIVWEKLDEVKFLSLPILH